MVPVALTYKDSKEKKKILPILVMQVTSLTGTTVDEYIYCYKITNTETLK